MLVNVYLWPGIKFKDRAYYVINESIVSLTNQKIMCLGKLSDDSKSSSSEDTGDQQMQIITPKTHSLNVFEHNEVLRQ